MPERIQLRRTKGWRKPPDAVVVARPSRWGNPYRIGDRHPVHRRPMSRDETIDLIRAAYAERPEWVAAARQALAGRDLACWCALDVPCHADVLLDVANSRD